MPTKRELVISLRTITKERNAEREAGHIHSKAADELAQTNRRLLKEFGELEALIEDLQGYADKRDNMTQMVLIGVLQHRFWMAPLWRGLRAHSVSGDLVKEAPDAD